MMNTLKKYNKIAFPVFFGLFLIGWFGYSSCVQNSYSGKTALECLGWALGKTSAIYLFISFVITNTAFYILSMFTKNIKVIHMLAFQILIILLGFLYFMFGASIGLA